MSVAQSIAKKRMWSKISKTKRSKIMSRVATIGQSKLSKSQKRAHALKMVQARNGK